MIFFTKFFSKTFFIIALLISLNSCDNFFKKSTLSTKISAEFIKGSLDIPVAKGLEIISDEEVEFDSSSGSFASSTYQSKNSIESIKKFYSETLPQMGWELIEFSNHSSIFKRENQTLKIEFSKAQKQILAVFILTN
jgi:imidazoleglycerol phosphate synthase glutamine amidotransferase subunit HisH